MGNYTLLSQPFPLKNAGMASLFLCCAKAKLLLAPKGGEPRSPPLESPIAICSAGIAALEPAIPAKKRGNGFLVFMLRKSQAFACTKRGRTAISPFGIPHRDMFSGNRCFPAYSSHYLYAVVPYVKETT